jgi:hypothetical protein
MYLFVIDIIIIILLLSFLLAKETSWAWMGKRLAQEAVHMTYSYSYSYYHYYYY